MAPAAVTGEEEALAAMVAAVVAAHTAAAAVEAHTVGAVVVALTAAVGAAADRIDNLRFLPSEPVRKFRAGFFAFHGSTRPLPNSFFASRHGLSRALAGGRLTTLFLAGCLPV